MAKRRKTKTVEAVPYPIMRQILGICLLALALFLLLSLLLDVTGSFGRFLSGTLFGLLGVTAYAGPVLLAYIGVTVLLDRQSTRLQFNIRFWSFLIAVLCLSVLLHTFVYYDQNPAGDNIIDSAVSLYANGEKLMSGGVLGGLLSRFFVSFLDKIGTGILVGALLFVTLMLSTGLTVYRVVKALIPKKEAVEAIGASLFGQRDAPAPPATRGASRAKAEKPDKKVRIDIPVDDLPRKPLDIDDIVGEARAESAEASQLQLVPVQITPTAKPKGESVSEPPKDAAPPAGPSAAPPYNFPPITLLEKEDETYPSDCAEELKGSAQKLIDTLQSFGVEVKILNISRGPTVTRYELQPNAGVKVSRITSLADDIALNLAAGGVRIEAPIPGKAAIGIEVPNADISSVYLRSLISSPEFKESASKLTACLGKDIGGQNIVTDISKMPHMLIAGSTGSGKSVCINSLIVSLLYKASPDEVKLLLIDPKVVELSVYNGIPHLLVPVVTDPKKASGALGWAVTEMLNRYKLFAESGVRDLASHNKQMRLTGGETLPQIVIVIDELADLMMVAPHEVEDAICRLAQMARAAGMHLIIATQRPSVDVITGTIKANIVSRIAFAVSSQVDSRIILDTSGAEKLIGRGDMLFLPLGAPKPLRVQGCYISEREVESVVEFIRRNTQAEYSEAIVEQIERSVSDAADDGGENASDELLPDAIECVIEAGQASTSLLQRRLKLGYARAARIIDEMEARGIIGPYEGSKPRKVLISRQQWQEMLLQKKQ